MSGAYNQTEFKGFSPEDFDAYLEEKWNSNMFTLPRRGVKGKLEAIGRILNEELAESGLSLVMKLSDEFPSLWNNKRVDTQWLFFSRDEAARAELTDLIDKERTLADTLADPTPRYRQIFLGLAVNRDHLEIGLRLNHDAWVDRTNLLNLVKDAANLQRLRALFGDLPEHYEIGLDDGETASPTSLGDAEIGALLDAFDAQKGGIFLGARLPRDQVPVLGEEVVDTAREVFRLLIPVYRFMAWSPDNDAISLDKLVAERNEALRASREEFDKEREERGARQREKEAIGLKLRQEIEDRARGTQSWRHREIASRRAAPARAPKADDARARAEALAAKWGLGGRKEEPAEPVRPAAAPTPGPAPAPSRERREPPKPRPAPPAVSEKRAAELQVGDLVEVAKGFLKGRRGIVQEIDEKGGIRVSFGALASRLATQEVLGMGPAADLPASESAGLGRLRGDPRKPPRRFHGKLPDADKPS